VYELHQAANQYHQLYRPHHLRSDSEEDDDTHRIAEGFEEVAVDMETLENGCMITRNILVKGDEVNIDGYQSMRLAMCLNGRPEVFRSYTASQQISLAVLCMEEDEVQDTGFPIVMSHDEEDDELVLPDYFNNIHLKVKNEDVSLFTMS
jgi:hypothetical protein